MPGDSAAAGRLTEIISLLRPERPRRLPASLSAAAAEGNVPAMQLFLDRGADIEHRAAAQPTALGVACAHGQAEAVRWLIERGARVDFPDDPQSPIDNALSKCNCGVAALLLDAGVPIERAAGGAIAAAMLGRLDVLHWLVGRGLDLDRSYPRLGVLRERALRTARKDARDLIAFLEGKVDPGVPPAHPPASASPLRDRPRAADADRQRLLQEALAAIHAAGRAVDQWNATGPAAPPQRQRLISFAASTGNVEIVTALLEAGASPNALPDGTPPPLTAAAGEAQVEIVRLLLQRGALPDGPDGKSWLALASALQSGDAETVQALLDAGANPKAKPAGGFKLADYARGPYAQELRGLLERKKARKASPAAG
jgi:ankyrin repeat protein